MDIGTVTFGLGLTGTAGVVFGFLYYFISKGLHSRCLIRDVIVDLDIHKATKRDKEEGRESKESRESNSKEEENSEHT